MFSFFTIFHLIFFLAFSLFVDLMKKNQLSMLTLCLYRKIKSAVLMRKQYFLLTFR